MAADRRPWKKLRFAITTISIPVSVCSRCIAGSKVDKETLMDYCRILVIVAGLKVAHFG